MYVCSTTINFSTAYSQALNSFSPIYCSSDLTPCPLQPPNVCGLPETLRLTQVTTRLYLHHRVHVRIAACLPSFLDKISQLPDHFPCPGLRACCGTNDSSHDDRCPQHDCWCGTLSVTPIAFSLTGLLSGKSLLQRPRAAFGLQSRSRMHKFLYKGLARTLARLVVGIEPSSLRGHRHDTPHTAQISARKSKSAPF